MPKRDNNSMRLCGMCQVRASLNTSEAGERDLEARYEHIRRSVDVARAGAELAKVDNAGFQELLALLDDLDVTVGADAVFSESWARAQPRFGLTLVLPGRRPLIWLNLFKHMSVAALVDTVVHEAIHATVSILRRYPRTPQPNEEIAYHGEELVALTSANHILTKINFPAQQEVTINIMAIEAQKVTLRQLGCAEPFMHARAAEGEAAAALLTDHLIKVDVPTLAEIRAHRSDK